MNIQSKVFYVNYILLPNSILTAPVENTYCGPNIYPWYLWNEIFHTLFIIFDVNKIKKWQLSVLYLKRGRILLLLIILTSAANSLNIFSLLHF
jgi:polyferredoxin